GIRDRNVTGVQTCALPILELLKFPLQSFAQNQIWCQIIQLASELVAWMQTIAFTSDDTRKWEPKRLRARLFEVPATLVRRCRHKVLHLALHAPEAVLVPTGVNRLRTALAKSSVASPPVPTTSFTSSREWNPTARNGHCADLSRPHARISS